MHTLLVKHGMLFAYHPQTDGQTEKVNYLISIYLHGFTRHNLDSWHNLLLIGEFAYNLSVHASTRKTPFEVDLSYTTRILIGIGVRTAHNYIKLQRLDTMGISLAEQIKLNLESHGNGYG
jgi:hypothetical protein